MNWYALFVETGAEETVEQYIYYHFDKSKCCLVIPKRRLMEVKNGVSSQVTRTLFPGYIFINVDMNADIYHKLRKIPKIYKVINQGGDYYSQVSDEEMKYILRLVKNSNTIDFSQVLIENSEVHVCSGPLLGMEGLIKKIDKRRGRAKVVLNLMGSPKTVDLGVNILNL
ncbi:MAG: antiterminator LoaP [Bacillota bacterium]